MCLYNEEGVVIRLSSFCTAATFAWCSASTTNLEQKVADGLCGTRTNGSQAEAMPTRSNLIDFEAAWQEYEMRASCSCCVTERPRQT
jgi:hypothetical protein